MFSCILELLIGTQEKRAKDYLKSIAFEADHHSWSKSDFSEDHLLFAVRLYVGQFLLEITKKYSFISASGVFTTK